MAIRHIPENRLSGASPTAIVVTTPGASTGARSTVVTGWPAGWTAFPKILTALRGTTLLGNLEATAQSGGTLTISGVIDGYTDFALLAGDVLELHPSALAITELHTELDALTTISDVAVSGAVTLTSSAFGKMHVCSGTTADYTIILPTAVGAAGKSFGVRMSNALTKLVTLDGNAAETINGTTIRVMWAGEVAVLESDGSNWNKIGGVSLPMQVRLSRATDQTGIIAGTWTAVIMTARDFGVPQLFDSGNGRIPIVRPGRYMVTVSAYVTQTTGTLTFAYATVGVNGTNLPWYQQSGTAGASAGSFATMLNLATGDHVETMVYNDATTAKILGGGGAHIAVAEIPSW